MIRQLSLIFGSKSKAQEIALLQQNAKKVVRHGFYDSELFKVEQFCHKNKLFLVKSNFKVLFADEGVYSNKGVRIPENDRRPGMYFVYISNDEQQAWLASYYELVQNHQDLGLVLGYPRCCVEFFCQNFSARNSNPEHKPTNPHTNLSKREQDLVIISHFPCDAECKESIVLGEKYLQAIYAVDKERARELLTSLKSNGN
ncbi:MAG: DUF483 domain-containing protein [Nanoarchaeota archaeon]|nr:DUF483 domain-containing protein [Nanoarchaeota archaeon]